MKIFNTFAIIAQQLRLDDAEPQVPLGGAEQDRVAAAGLGGGGHAAQEEEGEGRGARGVSQSPATSRHRSEFLEICLIRHSFLKLFKVTLTSRVHR